DVHSDLSAGKYRGIIFVVSYGHNNFMVSYKNHKLFKGNKEQFLQDYLVSQRREELEVLEELVPHVNASRGKLWLMTLVVKQDLWWPDRGEVELHYSEGEYNSHIQTIRNYRGRSGMRYE